ncbi:hypothetical protein AQJ30_13830 [Streptomyces longwoodensis]|uniref:Uncharacterized protein n=1 Tax=Streptomyces longwoodensis TaxID=68231 RepID=A0A101QZJ0_9ACTN|nr:hypothetical protein AQJ30_13830 [Streptomyces longwoodensis]
MQITSRSSSRTETGLPDHSPDILPAHQRGQIPFADRTPDDGKKPRVLEYHWYRETVNNFIRSRKGSGNFEPRHTQA